VGHLAVGDYQMLEIGILFRVRKAKKEKKKVVFKRMGGGGLLWQDGGAAPQQLERRVVLSEPLLCSGLPVGSGALSV